MWVAVYCWAADRKVMGNLLTMGQDFEICFNLE